jgi:pyruvate dehydrogenase E2 component (dihydrolipoyllysine-residue acetyltransferase)
VPAEITMPQLGLTMEYGTIIRWLISEGDEVLTGQEVCEVETDKAAICIEAHHTGEVARILASVGQVVPVGAPICVLVAPGEALPLNWQSSAAAPPAVLQPPVDAGIASCSSASQPDSATSTLMSVHNNGPVQASWKARTLARALRLDLSSIAGTGVGGCVVAADVLNEQTASANPEGEVGIKASPIALSLAGALGVELAQIPGTGVNGRIEREDVIRFVAGILSDARQPTYGSAQLVAPPRIIPLEGVRSIVSQRMAESVRATARVTLIREANANALVDLRGRLKAQDIQVGYNDLLIAICAAALREHPEANARLTAGGIEQLQEVHIGLAVDTDRGLLVPVIHHAWRMSLLEIAAESLRLIDEARSGSISPDDLTGGTFTLTSLGMFGVDAFTPVINLPESCILGVGRIVRKPVADEHTDAVVVQPRITLSLAFDHRVIDGAPAARFFNRIVELVEEPALLLALSKAIKEY